MIIGRENIFSDWQVRARHYPNQISRQMVSSSISGAAVFLTLIGLGCRPNRHVLHTDHYSRATAPCRPPQFTLAAGRATA